MPTDTRTVPVLDREDAPTTQRTLTLSVRVVGAAMLVATGTPGALVLSARRVVPTVLVESIGFPVLAGDAVYVLSRQRGRRA